MDVTRAAELARESLAFETRHKLERGGSGITGRSPMQVLAATQAVWQIPPLGDPPREPLPEPERGRYHVLRFNRSDCGMDIFAERFPVPPDVTHAYAWVNIDAREHMPPLRLAPDLPGERQDRVR